MSEGRDGQGEVRWVEWVGIMGWTYGAVGDAIAKGVALRGSEAGEERECRGGVLHLCSGLKQLKFLSQ